MSATRSGWGAALQSLGEAGADVAILIPWFPRAVFNSPGPVAAPPLAGSAALCLLAGAYR
jgi:hypothetical protein